VAKRWQRNMLTQAESSVVEAKVRPALLFVDDERRVLTSMRAMFRREYEVLLANSGDEAIDILADRNVHVVVSDQRMPEMTGVELLATVKDEYPGSMRILLTGYADLDAVEASINESEVFRYLMKPCPTDELKDAVRLAVQAARVSELAGVDELTAVPEEQLESIELQGIVEDSLQEKIDEEMAELPVLEVAEVIQVEGDFSESGFAADIQELGIATTDVVDAAESEVVPREEVDPEVLVLTQDSGLIEGVTLAIGPQYKVREAETIDDALRMLSEHPVGVLITDTAVNQDEIDHLTRTLKQEVPELVTIIASERSDAALLIGLINHGQIFRFLLKPLQVAQTRIWLTSAMNKYHELCSDSSEKLRYQVARNADVEESNTGLFANVRLRIKNIKERLASSLVTGLNGIRGE